MGFTQYQRPVATVNSGSVIWGSYGEFDKVVTVVSQSLANPRFSATGSNAGALAFFVSQSTNGNYTASMGGGGSLNSLNPGVVYRISLGELFVTNGAVYVLYSERTY